MIVSSANTVSSTVNAALIGFVLALGNTCTMSENSNMVEADEYEELHLCGSLAVLTF